MYNIATNNIFFYLEQKKDIANIAVLTLYPEIIHVWDHTTSKGKPRSGVGGIRDQGLKNNTHLLNERLERVELWPIFTYMNQIYLFLNAS